MTFLTHEDVAVRARAVGVIHNLSVDTVSIVPILETGCVPQIIGLMRDSSPEICHAAAGTIQNLSRDPDARAAIVAEGALEYLSDLLFASDIACQVRRPECTNLQLALKRRYVVSVFPDHRGRDNPKHRGVKPGASRGTSAAEADADGRPRAGGCAVEPFRCMTVDDLHFWRVFQFIHVTNL